MDDNYFTSRKDACKRLEPRVFAWSCCAALYVLCLWVYCLHSPSIGWRFFPQATENYPTLRVNFHHSSSLEECQLLVFPTGIILMRRRWRICLQVSPWLFKEYPSRFGVNHEVEVFTAFELLSFSLTNLLAAMDGSMLLLSLCQMLVMQAFAFYFFFEQSQVVD